MPKVAKQTSSAKRKRRTFDPSQVRLQPKKKSRQPRSPQVEVRASVHQRGANTGSTTGNAFFRFAFDAAINADFKAALKLCPWFGTPSFKRDDDNTWHVRCVGPRAWECFLESIPNSNRFKEAFAGKEVELPEGYVPPEVVVVVLEDSRVLLETTPANALYHHNSSLRDSDAKFRYERDFHGVDGFDRYVTAEGVDTEVVVDILNSMGFDVGEDDVCDSTYENLRSVGSASE